MKHEKWKGKIGWKWKKWIDNLIGNEEAKAISESLKSNTSLTSLKLIRDEKIRKWKWEKKSEEMINE